MPKKKWIDKKSATTFYLVHRAQNDPLIHDPEAPSMVFKEVQLPNLKSPDIPRPESEPSVSSKIKTLTDLENELGDSVSERRRNEGEAALYGIFYDDTQYDYMQHLREIGTVSDAVLVEAPKPKEKMQKSKLEDALASAADSEKIQLPEELLPSAQTVKRTYQDQQDVPDELRGFKPDMDPRLREVLEALEDDAYVDDSEEIFEALAKSGEASQYEFEEQEFFDEDGDDEGWESDATEKAVPKLANTSIDQAKSEHPEQGPSEEWLQEYSKYKKAQKTGKTPLPPDAISEIASSIGNLSLHSGFSSSSAVASYISSNKKRRQRRRKNGALTSSTGYSMSSSSISRTEGLTLLDDRFDRMEKLYSLDEEEDEDECSSEEDRGRFDDVASAITASTARTTATRSGNKPFAQETRTDFNSIMDEFLDSYTVGKGGRVKNMKPLTPMEQLDEIRRDLGKPKIVPSWRSGVKGRV